MSSWDVGVRLRDGVAVAAHRSRPSDLELTSSDVLADPEMGQCLERVCAARQAHLTAQTTDSIIGRLRERLAGNRVLLLGVLFGSDPLIAKFPPVGDGPLETAVFDRWFQVCWIAEAAWRAVTGELTDSEFAVGDRELLYPLAARLRFQALSEPMRFRAAKVNPWLPEEDKEGYGSHGVIGQVFGEDSWHLLVGRGREARNVWLDCLNSYQSHPLLASAWPAELEADLSWLVFARRYGGAPLRFSGKPLTERAVLNAEDRSVIEDAADRHLLPRFRLLGVLGLALHAEGGWERTGRVTMAVVTVLTAALAIVLVATLHPQAATYAAAASYGLVGAGAITFGSLWTVPWLLRLPAACALGLAVLVTLPSDWWLTPRVGFAAAVGLAGAAFGYLVVEARNHGAGRVAALWRSFGVAVVGSVHGLLVSLVGLVAVAPAFIDRGDELARLWRESPSYRQAGMILVLATSWCLAVGVFTQILWDDRPVTARLAHLQWRSGQVRHRQGTDERRP
ncbi:MAG: hypothetical protein ACRDTE_27950 [Pseudonocardiaceae bacterium]